MRFSPTTLRFAVATAALALTVGCEIASVVHPDSVEAGGSFQATLTANYTDTQIVTERAYGCAGVPVSWTVTGVTYSGSTPDQTGSGTGVPALPSDRNAPDDAFPDFDWFCFDTEEAADITTGATGQAIFTIEVPQTAAAATDLPIQWTIGVVDDPDEGDGTQTAIAVTVTDQPADTDDSLPDEGGEGGDDSGEDDIEGCDGCGSCDGSRFGAGATALLLLPLILLTGRRRRQD